jgi:GDPmannose 4,6-dehydratase
VTDINPWAIFNMAAMSHVQVSFECPGETLATNIVGCNNLLEASCGQDTRFYQASSSEMYGIQGGKPLNEDNAMCPVSPYGISKLAAYNLTRMHRDAYGTFAVNGILFNHESPRRGETFVTRKVTRYIGALRRRLKYSEKVIEPLQLGNLTCTRDWGHAKDYANAIYAMMQYEKPRDWVIATGEQHSVREFVEKAFAAADLPIYWDDRDRGRLHKHNQLVVVPRNKVYNRPLEIYSLLGDASKARQLLGWEPTYTFDELVEEMVEFDIEEAAA